MESSADTFGILDRVRGAVDVCSTPAGQRGVGEWMELIGDCSRALTVLAAARDAAVVRLAAIDEVVDEDGVVLEKVNGLGTVSLDAGAMVSTATGTSAMFGEELVEQAITRVVRVPALHEAMVDGILDDYKARCIASELSDVPADLGRTVLDALSGDLSTRSGPALRRRARDLLFRLSPDLLRVRLRTARKGVGLRRWVGEPGTDRWGGSLPSEHAARAWAAIDTLARRYRLDGTYPTLEMARAHALLDLVNGRATVEAVLHLTIPATVLDGATCGADRPAEPLRARTRGSASTTPPAGKTPSARETPSAGSTYFGAAGVQGSAITWMRWSDGQVGLPPPASRPDGDCQGAWHCHPETGALLDLGDRLRSTGYRPGEKLKDLVRRRDGRCRFPGCAVSARSCDLDHVLPWPNGPTSASNLICLCRRHHRIKQRHRWRVTLRPDGTVEWTDPSGGMLDTSPVDHLGVHEVRSVDTVTDINSNTVTNADADVNVYTDTNTDTDVNVYTDTGTDTDTDVNVYTDPHDAGETVDVPRADVSTFEMEWAVRADHGIAAVRAEARAGRRPMPTLRSWPQRRCRDGGSRVECTHPADDLGLDIRIGDYYPFAGAAPVADDAPPF